MPNALEKNNYSYKDYLAWNEGERIEIIDGEIYMMAPAPSRIHQETVGEIYRKIANYIEENNGECKVYIAPFDVRLSDKNEKDNEVRNVVQPDISVICDKSKLDDKGCNGSPDLIVEVVSSSNAATDYIYKLNLYNKYKVKEYWIVNPRNKTIMIYKLNEKGEYSEPETYQGSVKVKVEIFKDLIMDFERVF